MPFRNRHARAALVAGGLLAGTVMSAQAAELGFFEALFGGGRPAAQAVQPSQSAYDGGAYRRHGRRASRQHVRTRYAALPGAEPLKVRITDRQTPLDMKAGPVAALMKDETLRPGDIVVLNTGARVFTGDPDTAHTLRDFVPVERSGYVDRSTRRQLAALMAPPAALPADQARRFVETLKSTPRTPAALAPQQAAMRVVSPWIVAP
ncbi:hypothetical protein [uncultured Methylobacterium sp.]|uniref:hypothetical protein n=1 Tax=uncultured Methylobacterium sp. TaxID=157278 RepID=UPI0035CC12AC